MKQSLLLVTEKEIHKKLVELNLTHDPRLVSSRKEWFREQKIPIFTMYGRHYLSPKHVSVKEIEQHIRSLNKALLLLNKEKEACKRESIVLRREEDRYFVLKSVENHPSVVAAQIHLKTLVEELRWFSEKELKVRLHRIGEISYYSYE